METLRQRIVARVASLRRERATWEPHWRELAEQILPRRGRFNQGELNRGDKLNAAIINNAPMIAARVLASGMMAGITSPSRIWFRLTTADPDLADFGPVRRYLHLCEERIRWAFARSTWYNALADGVYPDLGVFGTACMFLEEDARLGIRATSLPLGEYFLACNADGDIDTCAREIPMTVRQMVQKFGLKRCSRTVQNAYERGNYDARHSVIHYVAPNEELEPTAADRRGMAYASRWFELASDIEHEWLLEGGYEERPFLAPLWAKRDRDAYGRSPGMDILGDCKQLQHEERRKAQFLDKLGTPPMKGSEALRAGRATLLPGDMTFLPNGQGNVFEPSIDTSPLAVAYQHTTKDILEIEQRIGRGMFEDLWLYIISDERKQRGTATEITEAKQETMLQLGPVLENLNGGLLQPGVERTHALLGRRGWLPPVPKELDGQELKTEFISVMHQVQKMTGLVGTRTLLQEVGGIVAMGRADALDKLNVDEIVDEIASMAGVKPEMVLSADEVKAVRAARQARQAAQEQGAAMLAATEGAKNLSAVDPQKLSQVAQTVSPVAAAQGGFPMQPGLA